MRLVILFFLCIFSLAVTGQNLDFRILKSINHSYTPAGGVVFKTVTNSIDPVSIGLPVGLCVGGLISKNKEILWNSYEIGSASIATSLFTGGLKVAIQRERPFNQYPDDIVKYTKGGSYSFPSGHTSSAFATATSISLIYPKWYVIVPAYVWAGGVGYSRMYLGVHFPTDVLAGALLGTGTSIGTHYLFKYIKKKRNSTDQVLL